MARVKNILITGGSGNIGMRLVNQLLGKGYMLRVADVKPPEQNQIDFVRVDITNWEDMDEATRGIDLVIHLAAIPIENGAIKGYFPGEHGRDLQYYRCGSQKWGEMLPACK
ncbi:MAG: NAD-dependent epimerase/dehydratase family protein [Oscillospiraceae bacterium]